MIKNKILNALKKDIAILEKQQAATKEYIKIGCGQFLNVGNDEYNGNHDEVLSLFDDMIKWAKKISVKLNALKVEPKSEWNAIPELSSINSMDSVEVSSEGRGYIDYVYDSWEKTFNSNEANVFLHEDPSNVDSVHHSLFPNLSKII